MKACESYRSNQDEQQHIELLHKYACEVNSAEAQFLLGWIYDTGDGVSKNPEKSFYWCQKAANQGHAKSLCELGYKYYKGKFIKKNYKKAMELFRKAAGLGDEKALLNLGDMHFYGHGVKQDKEKASQMYRKASTLKPLKIK